jgi:site-specific recombinase XerD
MADGHFAHLRGHWALTAPTEARDGSRHLAAIRMMFDWLATGGILPFNPATAVRGPKHVVKRGKTRSGLSLNQSDGVFHPPEHALLTATEPLALGGR